MNDHLNLSQKELELVDEITQRLNKMDHRTMVVLTAVCRAQGLEVELTLEPDSQYYDDPGDPEPMELFEPGEPEYDVPIEPTELFEPGKPESEWPWFLDDVCETGDDDAGPFNYD